MKTKERLGVWMDYSTAYMMEMKEKYIITIEIKSDFTSQEKKHSLGKNENLMHHKQHDLIASYFTQIENHIQGFDKVVLFGPGDAKNELFNHMTTNAQFAKVDLTLKSSDKLTENQRKAFVRNYFETSHAVR
jgi:stalled ribosome rescue protein Dom34